MRERETESQLHAMMREIERETAREKDMSAVTNEREGGGRESMCVGVRETIAATNEGDDPLLMNLVAERPSKGNATLAPGHPSYRLLKRLCRDV